MGLVELVCPGNFVPADKLEKLGQEAPGMAKRKYTAEEIVTVGCAQCIKLFLEDAMFGFAAGGMFEEM